MRKFYDKEIWRRVDEVLYYIWDPIGVAEEPYARAEYESYVPMVLQLVEQNDTIQPISAYLEEIINNRMGLSADKKHCDYTAEILLFHKKAIKDGCA
ncbi:MAG: hypothetical protein JXD22_08845 [Sedimentisphaerales bacterium]|nr:hypothetical protein [Sedimentisphaerales bacterium]